MNELLSTEIYNGRSLGDFMSLEFLVGIFGNILSAVLVLFVGFMIAGWVARRIRALAETHKRLDDTLFDFLANIVRYVIIGLSVLIVLNTFGIQTTSLVAVIGAAGLAVGLALQGTLSNVAAGVMLIFFRPIKIGDFVQINDETGTVKTINLNFTELASIGNVQIIIPNSEVWGNTITNYSAYDTRQAEWTFGVGYSADLDTVERVIRETITADPRFLAEPAETIKVTALGASSVDFLVRAWVPRTEFFDFWKDMNREVKLALDRAGVEIPFPNRTVHIVKDE